ncbi:MAG: hypothetical protein PSX81_04220 [bacterium]|nr:hypothetical protein [bacterium]
MTFTDKHIVETYSGLIDGLSSTNKKKLIEKLTKSLKVGNKTIENRLFKSFCALSSKKTAEEIIKDIKSNRKFKNKDIQL